MSLNTHRSIRALTVCFAINLALTPAALAIALSRSFDALSVASVAWCAGMTIFTGVVLAGATRRSRH
jgi:hypothetical protein